MRPESKVRATCHPTRAHEANGLCRKCYRASPPQKNKTKIWSKAYREKYPENVRRAQKEYQLQRHYGISLQEYERRLREQDGRCAICLIPSELLKRQLAVDHDHITGVIRGLLCIYCNTAVGQIERVGIEHLSRVETYLRSRHAR